MSIKESRYWLRQQAKEVCRELNKHPIQHFTDTFKKTGILKEYCNIFPWENQLTQHFLQSLKDGKKRFIMSIAGVYRGSEMRIWILRANLTNPELNRASNEKLKDIEEQMLLFNEMKTELEQRTGKEQFKISSQILKEIREQLTMDTPKQLPPPRKRRS